MNQSVVDSFRRFEGTYFHDWSNERSSPKLVLISTRASRLVHHTIAGKLLPEFNFSLGDFETACDRLHFLWAFTCARNCIKNACLCNVERYADASTCSLRLAYFVRVFLAKHGSNKSKSGRFVDKSGLCGYHLLIFITHYCYNTELQDEIRRPHSSYAATNVHNTIRYPRDAAILSTVINNHYGARVEPFIGHLRYHEPPHIKPERILFERSISGHVLDTLNRLSSS